MERSREICIKCLNRCNPMRNKWAEAAFDAKLCNRASGSAGTWVKNGDLVHEECYHKFEQAVAAGMAEKVDAKS
jgi:hypothetical protein